MAVISVHGERFNRLSWVVSRQLLVRHSVNLTEVLFNCHDIRRATLSLLL